MASKEFLRFLHNLGYAVKDLQACATDELSYEIPIGGEQQNELRFIYATSEERIYDAHRKIWNSNDQDAFVAVTRESAYLIDGKIKPDEHDPQSIRARIKSFEYGTNSRGYSAEDLAEISKNYVDSAYFFDFVIKNRKSNREQAVDKDLLLNLIALRNDLVKIDNDEDTIHTLILRCLFVKYLEDKGIYNDGYLADALAREKPTAVLSVFNEIRKINGDIFKFERGEIELKLRPEYLKPLSAFFTTDYRTGQAYLFPYMFDRIPIQLISNVYEAFLKNNHRQGKGIYYTPTFLVNFVLKDSLQPTLKLSDSITVFDPAVGSAAFLVQSFKVLVKHAEMKAGRKISFHRKKLILQNQLFGVDTDKKALEIAAFSLYLSLIETERPEFIRRQIEQSHPILPSLIGSTLICGNTITDDIFPDRAFDCIVSNPPWGTAKPDDDPETDRERLAIGEGGRAGTMHEYTNVFDYERSQAFLLRVKKWSHQRTVFALIVKNSIFLNDKSVEFRQDFLRHYDLDRFYELSNYNRILFKEKIIGEVDGRKVSIGASEPCVVVVFRNTDSTGRNKLRFISPKLTEFAKAFEVIHYTDADEHEIEQQRFKLDDMLWRVLVNGGLEDFELIRRVMAFSKELTVECRSGFQATTSMVSLGKPDLRVLIEPKDIRRQTIKDSPSYFNFNQKLHRRRDEEIFEGPRMLFPNRPLKSDNLRLRCVAVDSNVIHKDNISCIRLDSGGENVRDYSPYLALFNSRFIGYLVFHTASQWGMGDMKREKIKNSDIENLPVPRLPGLLRQKLANMVQTVSAAEGEKDVFAAERKIDEAVMNLYDLTTYEKEIVREFYQVRVERTRHSKYAAASDLLAYAHRFAETFSLMIENGQKVILKSLNISPVFGAAVCFTVGKASAELPFVNDAEMDILHLVKNRQIQNVDVSKILNEGKVKIYKKEYLYIVKSNLFKDWTQRQAVKDAREEIGFLLSYLPPTNAK